MAKRTPVVEEVEQVEASTESIRDTLEEKFGKIVTDGGMLKANVGKFISTGLVGMDIALNGGIREGTIVHIGGVQKNGKTTLCLHILAQAQAMGKTTYMVDVEGRLQPELLACIAGLDPEKVIIIKSAPGEVMAAEKYLEILEVILRDDPGCVVVVDSIAALCPEVEMASNMTDQQRATVPKLMAKFLRKIAQILPSSKSTLITITHMQANPTGYGSPFKSVGGNSVEYFASYLLTNISAVTVKDKNEKVIGKNSTFKITAVANGSPGGEPVLPIRFGRGCDKHADLFTIASDLGVIKASGAWYSIEIDSLKGEDGKYPKLQGEAKTCAFLEDPKVFDTVAKEVKALCLK